MVTVLSTSIVKIRKHTFSPGPSAKLPGTVLTYLTLVNFLQPTPTSGKMSRYDPWHDLISPFYEYPSFTSGSQYPIEILISL